VSSPASRAGEIAALAVIALLVLLGGRLLLHALGQFRLAAAIALTACLVAGFISARRTYAAAPDDARVTITKAVAYLVAGGLALWEVLAPAKWIPGSCIAAAEVALIFDIIVVASRSRAAGKNS
jgi:hypothetical protein